MSKRSKKKKFKKEKSRKKQKLAQQTEILASKKREGNKNSNKTKNLIKKTLGTILEGTVWIANALIFPIINIQAIYKSNTSLISTKKIAVYLMAWHVLHPMAGLLFPTAKEEAKKLGLNPEVIEELAPGKNIRVRTDNFWGKLHALCDGVTPLKKRPFTRAFDIFYRYKNYIKPENGFGGICRPAKELEKLFFSHIIYIKHKEPRKTLINLTKEEEYIKTLLHEVRHGDEKNLQLTHPLLIEGDADYHAIRILMRERNKPHLKDFFIARSLLGGTHDTALYLDAKSNNKDIPPAEDMIKANEAVKNISHELFLQRSVNTDKAHTTMVNPSPEFKIACKNKHKGYGYLTKSFSPLAMRRKELYLKTIDREIHLISNGIPLYTRY